MSSLHSLRDVKKTIKINGTARQLRVTQEQSHIWQMKEHLLNDTKVPQEKVCWPAKVVKSKLEKS